MDSNTRDNDNIEKRRVTDTRKPELPISALHKLRKIRKLREMEKENLFLQLEKIYGSE